MLLTIPQFPVVHSAGVSHEMPVDFVDTTEEEMNHIVSLNVNGTVKVIKAILPGMVQRYVVLSIALNGTINTVFT